MADHDKQNSVLKIYHLFYNVFFTEHYYLVFISGVRCPWSNGNTIQSYWIFHEEREDTQTSDFCSEQMWPCANLGNGKKLLSLSQDYSKQKLIKRQCSHRLPPPSPCFSPTSSSLLFFPSSFFLLFSPLLSSSPPRLAPSPLAPLLSCLSPIPRQQYGITTPIAYWNSYPKITVCSVQKVR